MSHRPTRIRSGFRPARRAAALDRLALAVAPLPGPCHRAVPGAVGLVRVDAGGSP